MSIPTNALPTLAEQYLRLAMNNPDFAEALSCATIANALLHLYSVRSDYSMEEEIKPRPPLRNETGPELPFRGHAFVMTAKEVDKEVDKRAESPKFMTTKEVAELFRTSPETVRYWRTMGTGPKSFKTGKRVLYARSDVMAWINSDRSGGVR